MEQKRDGVLRRSRAHLHVEDEVRVLIGRVAPGEPGCRPVLERVDDHDDAVGAAEDDLLHVKASPVEVLSLHETQAEPAQPGA